MKEWCVLPEITEDFISEHNNISRVLLQLLFNRGLKKDEEIKLFLSGELDKDLTVNIGESNIYSFYNPFLFKDMEEAVKLIISHIKNGNKIVVYGDYDADGVTASVILLETLKILQAQTEAYLPDRVSEGYGLNKSAIDQIAEQDFRLIITVDNGTRNKEEVAYAKSLGIDVIITDHHILPESEEDLPDCLLINPSDARNNYPFSYLAGVGVSFKLICALLLKSSLSEKQKQLIVEKSLDLVAVGTIADMVSLQGENRLLVKKGLEILNQKKRLGLNELIKSAKINLTKKLEAWNVGWQIGPRLNAASRLSHANTAFALLVTTSQGEAEKLAEELNQRNITRQEITKEISLQVEEQIEADNLPKIIIGVCGEKQEWNEGVIGLVAGRIAEKYYRPTLVITRLAEDEDNIISFKASGRSIPELNLIKAIEECSDILYKYGGHPMACGLSVQGEDRLEEFKKRIEIIAERELVGLKLLPKLEIEAELQASEINLEIAEQISALAPFGQYNNQPNFVSYGLIVEDILMMGIDSQHIKLRLNGIWALAFGGAEKYQRFKIGDKVDIVYYLEINEFNGRKDPQFKIIDLKLKS